MTIPIRPALLEAALLDALGEEVSAALRPPVARRGPAREQPLRILLAEDNVVNQRVALGLLRREGYSADLAANGLEALDALRRNDYDVVLLDVQMPELDGLETARRIRREWSPGPWLIAVTASALHGDREACLEAGMDDYLAKPFRAEALAAALARCPAAVAERAHEPAPGADAAAIGTDLEDLVASFLSEADACLASIHAAAAVGDASALKRAVHDLKGSAGLLGAGSLEAACRELEVVLFADESADLSAHVARVGAELEALRVRPPRDPVWRS